MNEPVKSVHSILNSVRTNYFVHVVLVRFVIDNSIEPEIVAELGVVDVIRREIIWQAEYKSIGLKFVLVKVTARLFTWLDPQKSLDVASIVFALRHGLWRRWSHSMEQVLIYAGQKQTTHSPGCSLRVVTAAAKLQVLNRLATNLTTV